MNDLAKEVWRGTAGFSAALLGLILVCGGLGYHLGWLLWAHFLAWTFGSSLYFLKRDPELVRRRLNVGPTAEQRPAQKRILWIASAALTGLFVVAGLDHRHGWSAAPVAAVVAGHVLLAVGFLVTILVLRENTFAAATVATIGGQQVIATGPYAIVRHPMYAGALVMFVGIPLALGSWWALLPFVVLIAALVARIGDEEALLQSELAGYTAYQARVRFRLVPGVW